MWLGDVDSGLVWFDEMNVKVSRTALVEVDLSIDVSINMSWWWPWHIEFEIMRAFGASVDEIDLRSGSWADVELMYPISLILIYVRCLFALDQTELWNWLLVIGPEPLEASRVLAVLISSNSIAFDL